MENESHMYDMPFGSSSELIDPDFPNKQTPHKFLISLGFNPSELGFAYLAYGITIAYANCKAFYSDKVDILLAIANEFHVTKNRAVDNMQHSIYNVWHGGNAKEVRRLFPSTEFILPKPLDFICCAAIMLAEE